MPERSLEGIQITETPGAEQPIARASAHLTAFVGRTLRGPVNRRYHRSQLCGFSAGVRRPVAAEPALLRSRALLRAGRTAGSHRSRCERRDAGHAFRLRCGRECLHLEARAPGTREFLRASIDYDHIDADDEQRFNLVVQRVRSPGSERIEAQETFRGAVDRSGLAALRRRRAARIQSRARARRSARDASGSHADARHEPAGRLRELEPRRQRRPPDLGLRRDRLRDAALRACSRSKTSTSSPSYIYRR